MGMVLAGYGTGLVMVLAWPGYDTGLAWLRYWPGRVTVLPCRYRYCLVGTGIGLVGTGISHARYRYWPWPVQGRAWSHYRPMTDQYWPYWPEFSTDSDMLSKRGIVLVPQNRSKRLN